jgi:hypothetical protein
MPTGAGAGVPFSVFYGLYGQTTYQRLRIPTPAPAPDKTDQKPGYLCWGDEGTLPTPTPAVGPNIEMKPDEVHTEVARKAVSVRIQNPDDPSQYIMVRRADEITFKKTGGAAGPAPEPNSFSNSNFSEPPPTSTDAKYYAYIAPSVDAWDQQAPSGLKVIFHNEPGAL